MTKGPLRSKLADLFFGLQAHFDRREWAQVDSKSSHFFSQRAQNIGEVLARRARPEHTFMEVLCTFISSDLAR